MSRENIETVRRAYETMARGDLDAAFESAEPALELIPPGQSPTSEPVRGSEAIMAWLADQRETVGELTVEVEELIEAEELVVALLRRRIRPHDSEAGFELQIAHLWTHPAHSSKLKRGPTQPQPLSRRQGP